MKLLVRAFVVLIVGLQFGFEEGAPRVAYEGSEGGFSGMVGYGVEELVDPRAGDGSGGRCTYE